MLIDTILQDKFLTGVIVVVCTIWLYVFYRNLRLGLKTSNKYWQDYNQILQAKEYKVKGRFEE